MSTPLTTTAEPLARLFVQRGIGITIEGRRYWHPILAAYVGQYVDTRYDRTQDALIILSENGDQVCTATWYENAGFSPRNATLPPPTQSWMGDLHRAFSASPAETANAVLRKRVADLEESLLDTKRHSEDAMRLLNDAVAHSKKCTDAMTALFAENTELRAAPLHVYNYVDTTSQCIDDYYNGNSGASHADQMAANEAAYLSPRTAQLDRLNAAIAAFADCKPPATYPGRLDAIHFADEMAAWPPVYEEPIPGPLRRFVNCLRESAARLVAKGVRA